MCDRIAEFTLITSKKAPPVKFQGNRLLDMNIESAD